MSQIVPITLPDFFYLPRYSRCGFEIRDVMPWEDALSYVTDGMRFGAHLRDGRVRWLLVPVRGGAVAGQYVLARELLPPALRIDVGAREIVREIWRENAELLAGMGGVDRSTPAAGATAPPRDRPAAGRAQPRSRLNAGSASQPATPARSHPARTSPG